VFLIDVSRDGRPRQAAAALNFDETPHRQLDGQRQALDRALRGLLVLGASRDDLRLHDRAE
jgi:hypothetical protein